MPLVLEPMALDWTFVARLRRGTSFEADELCGRVEHFAIRKASDIDSLQGMCEFMQTVLRVDGSLSFVTEFEADPNSSSTHNHRWSYL